MEFTPRGLLIIGGCAVVLIGGGALIGHWLGAALGLLAGVCIPIALLIAFYAAWMAGGSH